MSGGYVPYHLRTNKAVERQLFLETMKKINDFFPMKHYTYVGFGGNFLEDYKLFGATFDFREMISIENDTSVHKRQLFNTPSRTIQCTLQESAEFIDDLNPTTHANLLVWLDYANADLNQQLTEISDLLRKMKSGDILKITFNAHLSNLDRPKLAKVNKYQNRWNNYQSKTGRFFPSTYVAIEHFKEDEKKLQLLMKKTIKVLIDSIFAGPNELTFQPLTSYYYKDGAPMFTLTGIVLSRNIVRGFLEKTKFPRWNLNNLSWQQDPIQIDVPWLSIKEKTTLDSFLPQEDINELRQIHDDTKVSLCDEKSDSFEMFKEYAKYSKYVSQFMRVSI